MVEDNRLLDAVRSAVAGELRTALKGRNAAATAGLRAALGALDNATAVSHQAIGTAHGAPSEVARRIVSRAEIEALLLGEAQERAAAAIEYVRLAQTERAERLRAEARAIRGCLKHLGAGA